MTTSIEQAVADAATGQATLNQEFARLLLRIDERLTAMDSRLATLEKRLTALDAKLSVSGHDVPLGLLRLPQLKAMVGLGRTEIYQRIREGRFPHPVKLGQGSRLVAWRRSDLARWMAELAGSKELSA